MKKFFLLAFASFLLVSCHSHKGLYSWYNYEDTTYKFSKTHEEKLQPKVIKEYERIINKQKGIRKAVPPGMYAEYGYLLYKIGREQEGIQFLQKEIELYPESTIYIIRIIKQLKK